MGRHHIYHILSDTEHANSHWLFHIKHTQLSRTCFVQQHTKPQRLAIESHLFALRVDGDVMVYMCWHYFPWNIPISFSFFKNKILHQVYPFIPTTALSWDPDLLLPSTSYIVLKTKKLRILSRNLSIFSSCVSTILLKAVPSFSSGSHLCVVQIKSSLSSKPRLSSPYCKNSTDADISKCFLVCVHSLGWLWTAQESRIAKISKRCFNSLCVKE